MSTKIEKVGIWLGLPGLLVACVVALGTIFGVFGFQIKTPEQSLKEHVSEFSQFKSQADSIHVTTDSEVQKRLEHVEGYAMLPIRRSCVRDSYEELAIQGFLPACEDLGIVRRPGDRGAREAASSGQPVDLTIEDPVATIPLHNDEVDTLSTPDTIGGN